MPFKEQRNKKEREILMHISGSLRQHIRCTKSALAASWCPVRVHTNRERSWNALREAKARCFCWWGYFLLNVWGIWGSCLLFLVLQIWQKFKNWKLTIVAEATWSWMRPLFWMRHQNKAKETFGLFMLLLFPLLLLLHCYFQMNDGGGFFVCF